MDLTFFFCLTATASPSLLACGRYIIDFLVPATSCADYTEQPEDENHCEIKLHAINHDSGINILMKT